MPSTQWNEVLRQVTLKMVVDRYGRHVEDCSTGGIHLTRCIFHDERPETISRMKLDFDQNVWWCDCNSGHEGTKTGNSLDLLMAFEHTSSPENAARLADSYFNLGIYQGKRLQKT